MINTRTFRYKNIKYDYKMANQRQANTAIFANRRTSARKFRKDFKVPSGFRKAVRMKVC